MRDPTREEMLEVIQRTFGAEADAFDTEEAIYWFANAWHGGQASNLYSALSTSEYNPGPIANGPEPESMAEMIFEELECTFTEEAS